MNRGREGGEGGASGGGARAVNRTAGKESLANGPNSSAKPARQGTVAPALPPQGKNPHMDL